MVSVIRTIGPLHLEDLEPRRFEDLVRQLIYDFKDWNQLEATGRSGSDDGFDARGIENLPGAPELPPDETTESEGIAPPQTRTWLIQCKREQSIGPKKLTNYLDDIAEHEREGIYGIIFAAACDFSKKARDEFRDKCRDSGFAEAHLWGKAEVEDMLFQPKNDHLLFAYFGISLQTRKRSLKTEIRSRVATKKKAKKVLHENFPVLIRDASDDRYPWLDPDENLSEIDRGRWGVYQVDGVYHDGIRILAQRHFAFLDLDGVHWDIAEKMNDARLGTHDDPWFGEKSGSEDREEALQIWNKLDEKNQGWLTVSRILHFDDVLVIDEEGDDWVDFPIIYTSPWYDDGIFETGFYVHLRAKGFSGLSCEPEESHRVKKFPRK